MKRRLLSPGLILCTVLTVTPVTAAAEDVPVPTVSGKYICANGVPIQIEAGGTPDLTNILYDRDHDGVIEDTEYLKIGSTDPTAAGYNLSAYTIFGGAQVGTITNDSLITVNGGNVGSVYGGNFSFEDMSGGVTIVMNGGSVARLLACGYNNAVGGANKAVSVVIHGGVVRGGPNDDVDLIARNKAGTTLLLIDGGLISGAIAVKSGGTFIIKGGSIPGSVLSGVNYATPADGTESSAGVCKTVLTLMTGSKVTANTAVTMLTADAGYSYGMTDVVTDANGKLYVYLPAGTSVTSATAAGDRDYIGSVITAADGSAAGVLTRHVLLWSDGLTADASSAFGGGAGTQADPYRLASAEDVAQLALNVNNGTTYAGVYFTLTADIDLAGKYWIPIGNGDLSRSFRGILDGGHHKIRNMAVDDSTFSFNGLARYGFISWMYGATVKNLGLENASVVLGASGETAYEAALLVGLMQSAGTIENCYAVGTVTAARNVDNVGGLVGKSYSGGTLKDCYFSGTVKTAGGAYAGGLLGYLQGGATPVNGYVAARIISAATYQYAVAAAADNCYYDRTLNAAVTGGQGTAKTTAEMKTTETAAALGSTWMYADGGYPRLKSFGIDDPVRLIITSMQIDTSPEGTPRVSLTFTADDRDAAWLTEWISAAGTKISVCYDTVLNGTFESCLSDIDVQDHSDGTGTISGSFPQNMPCAFFRMVIE